MRRLNSQVQFRSREASPLTYTVAIPLAHMILAAVGVGLVITLATTWLLGVDLAGAATTGGAVALLLTALFLTLRFGREVLWGLERATRQDLDGDQVIGEPEEPRLIYVKGTTRRNSHDDDLADFVRDCYTRGTGRRGWAGARLATTNHKLSKGMWARFTGIMLKAGVLENAPGGGTELTCELEEALRILRLE